MALMLRENKTKGQLIPQCVFFLFDSTKPPSKVLILIYRNRSVHITFVLKGNASFVYIGSIAGLLERENSVTSRT